MDLIKVEPASISEGDWLVKTSHLAGYDHVCETREQAMSIAYLLTRCMEAHEEQLIKQLEQQ